MVNVPGPLRSLFDTFPLKTYPPIQQTQTLPQNVHYFTLNTLLATESLHSFCLGVHNVQAVAFSTGIKQIATDPFSLANSLILCLRNGLKLPGDTDNLPKTGHSIKVLSYLASRNNELPLLIDTREKVTESVTTSDQFRESVALRYFSDDPQGFLLNSLMDSWVDLWILILLADIPQAGFSDYKALFHQDSEIITTDFVHDLTVLKLLGDISNWSSFRKRYPHLFHAKGSKLKAASKMSREAFFAAASSCNARAMEVVYFEKLGEFERSLPLIMKYLESAEEGDCRSVIEIKLASFVFVVSRFVSDHTHIGRALRFKYEDIVAFSEAVVSKY